MGSQALTESVEDYLKTIFELVSIHGRASTTQIAEVLDVKPASVTGMVQRLAETDPPLLVYEKHRGVLLTPTGEKAALEVIRSHRLIERFLYEILGFSWDKVHEEAHRLEHVISEEFEERMAAVLGNPTHDPHGDPIPSRDLKMPTCTNLCLHNLQVGQTAIVKRVPDADSALLCYLAEVGVIPGTCIEVMDYSPFDENLKIKVAENDELIVFGPRITTKIYVEIIP